MSILRLQIEFCQSAALLIMKAKELGIGCTFGETYRTPEQAELDAEKGIGVKNSLHTQRLAIDLMLFDKNGNYLDGKTPESKIPYQVLGEYWKSLGSDYCWGGDFQRVDLDHFSITPDGVHK